MDEEALQGKVIIDETDISHTRLIELARLADQAKPFYEWVEKRFQTELQRSQPLNDLLLQSSKTELVSGMSACYQVNENINVPILFDGIGRSYPHRKACFYFFSWMIRDAPKQRLEPLIKRIARFSKRPRTEVEIEAIAALIEKYRSEVKTFSWEAIREIIIDRLEGSRRSIVGREREAVVRTALLIALQSYFSAHSNYGKYTKVELSERQILLGSESYDVSARLLDENGNVARSILVPVKTRETEGGGHAHLFTRDILSAINSARANSPHSFLIAVIVALNWSSREADTVRERVDYAAIFNLSPHQFTVFDNEKQNSLNEFVAKVLEGTIEPKSKQS